MTAALVLFPPNLPPRLRIMPNDNETIETLAPPTDRDAPTQTDNPKPHRDAVNPPPAGSPSPATADSIFSEAVRQIVDAASVIRAERESRRAFEETQLGLTRQTLAAIDRADRNQTANYNLLRDEIRHLKDSDLKQDERLKEGDKRFELIEAKLTEIETRLVAKLEERMNEAIKPIADELEAVRALLAELKTHGPRTSEAPST